jgi:hypothetical protein
VVFAAAAVCSLLTSAALPFAACHAMQAVKQVWEQDARSRKQLANRAHALKACLLDTTTVLRRAKQGERWDGHAAGCISSRH